MSAMKGLRNKSFELPHKIYFYLQNTHTILLILEIHLRIVSKYDTYTLHLTFDDKCVFFSRMKMEL